MTKDKKQVLIIDDDKFLLDMYATKFSQNGFSVKSCLGAEEAVQELHDGLEPDVILTDILMPAMDGFEFLEKLKTDKLAQGAKVIVLSNKGERADIDRGTSLGADGYIIKASAIPSEVVDKVQEVLAE